MGDKHLWQRAIEAEQQHKLTAAIDLYKQAEAAGYDADACASDRWRCYMLLGDYASAWLESDAIDRRASPDPHRFWDGGALANHHVLIRCLHGLGDTLQYIRFAPLLRRATASLTVEAQPTLKALLKEANIADHVIAWGDPEPFWEKQIEIVELPRIFRATLDSLPHQVPYLQIENAAVLPVCDHGMRVGVVWESGAYNPTRTVPISEFAQLFDAPNVCFYSLQGGPARHACPQSIPSLYEEPGDALVTAEVLNSLDLIITVDTMIAHLAGALGRRVWTLLPFHPDWRWMLKREDSPWYPGMRLFRQREPGMWRGPLEQVKAELVRAGQGKQER